MTIVETHFGIDVMHQLRQDMQETFYMIQCNIDFCKQRKNEQIQYVDRLMYAATPTNEVGKRISELITSAEGQYNYFWAKYVFFRELLEDYTFLRIETKMETHMEYRTKLLPILIY